MPLVEVVVGLEESSVMTRQTLVFIRHHQMLDSCTTNPRYQLEVGSVGAGGTQLWVNGDARITGILSVGTATITLDPTSNKVQIGTGITIDATTNTIEVAGSKIADSSGNSAFTGIVTATTVQSRIRNNYSFINSHNINSTGIVTSTQLNVTGHTEILIP